VADYSAETTTLETTDEERLDDIAADVVETGLA